MFDPYAAPTAEASALPRVIVWYRAYAATMAIFGLALCGASTMTLFAVDEGLANPSARGRGATMLVAALLVTAFFGVAARVPRKPWGWTYALVAIAVGIPSCTFVVAIPLARAWLAPRTRAAFGRPPL